MYNPRKRKAYNQNANKRLRYIVKNLTPKIPRQKLKPEIKTVDTSAASMYFDTNSAVANCMKLLNTIPTGVLAINRLGKKVEGTAVHIRGYIQASSATVYEKVTLLLVWIRNANQFATLPAVTDILVSQNSNSLTNRDNAPKFKIVRRWDYTIVGDTTTVDTESVLQNVEHYVPLKAGKYVSTWTQGSANGTIGEFEQGAMILLTVGFNANGATTTPVGEFKTRYYFYDV